MESRALVPIEQASVDLAKLHLFKILKLRMTEARRRYYKLHKSVLEIANSYFAEDPLTDTVIRLRREIRMATKGTPLTIAQDSITAAGYVTFGTEQLFNAESHLSKAAYRAVVGLVHPDRNGGDTTLFQLVNAAYHLRDLTYLQELYITLTKDNVFWRCREGLNYMQQEIERPTVSMRMLQNLSEFKITQAHLQQRHAEAKHHAELRLQRLVIELQNELTYLLTKSLSTKEGEPHAEEQSSDEESGNEESSGEDREEGGYQDVW